MGIRFLRERYSKKYGWYIENLPKWFRKLDSRLERRRSKILIQKGESPNYKVVPKSEVRNQWY